MNTDGPAGFTLGDRLRSARKDAGKNLDDVAHQADISKSYLSDLENGKLVNPSITVLGQLAEVLGVSVGWLTDGGPQLDPDAVAELHTGPLDPAIDMAEQADAELINHGPNYDAAAVRAAIGQVWALIGLGAALGVALDEAADTIAGQIEATGQEICDRLDQLIAKEE